MFARSLKEQYYPQNWAVKIVKETTVCILIKLSLNVYKNTQKLKRF